MSGPKCGSYRVESAAEILRRQVRAATDAYNRAAATYEQMVRNAQADENVFGAIDFDIVQYEFPGADLAAIQRQTAEIIAATGRLDAQHADYVIRRRSEQLKNLGGEVKTRLQQRERKERAGGQTATAQSEPPVNEVLETYARLVSRLPPDSDRIGECETLLASIIESNEPTRQTTIMLRVREIVDAENERSERHAAISKKVEALQRQLDGYDTTDPEVSALRSELDQAVRTHHLDGTLADRVRAARDRCEAELDRDYVLQSMMESLGELGYDVTDEFDTAVSDGGAIIDLPHSKRHGVRVREDDGQLFINVVRYDDPRDARADESAESRFCDDFGAVRRRLSERGITLDMTRMDAPGVTIPQLAHRSGGDKRTRTPSRSAERSLHK